MSKHQAQRGLSTAVRDLFATADLWPMDIPISQSWADMGAQLMAMQEFGIQTYIEIGIDQGGWAALVALRTMSTDLVYRGADNDLSKLDPRVWEILGCCPQARIIELDCFSPEGVAWLREGLALPGPALVLCDGGDKPREVQLVAPLLRPGDYVMVHDFTVWCQPEDVPTSLVRLYPPWLDRTLLGLYWRPL